MESKRDKIVSAAKWYVRTRNKYINCQQKHTVQHCYKCEDFADCRMYCRMIRAWERLEKCVEQEHKN